MRRILCVFGFYGFFLAPGSVWAQETKTSDHIRALGKQLAETSAELTRWAEQCSLLQKEVEHVQTEERTTNERAESSITRGDEVSAELSRSQLKAAKTRADEIQAKLDACRLEIARLEKRAQILRDDRSDRMVDFLLEKLEKK